MTPNKGSRTPILGHEDNGARKVKSDAQLAMNKNSDPMQKFFLRSGFEASAPYSSFFELLDLSETNRARKLIFGLQV